MQQRRRRTSWTVWYGLSASVEGGEIIGGEVEDEETDCGGCATPTVVDSVTRGEVREVAARGVDE